MNQQRSSTGLFLILILISLMIFGLDRLSMFAFAQSLFGKGISNIPAEVRRFTLKKNDEGQLVRISNLSELERLKKENENLRGQLGIAKVLNNPKLIFANVISTSRGFIIDKGEKDGVHIGNTVVFKNIFVGSVVKVNNYTSRILLPTDAQSVTNAKSSKTVARGLVRGQGGQAEFSEVTLSEELVVGDSIITVGNIDEEGLGIWPDLFIGTIEDIRQSNDPLYQEAKVVPLIDYKNLQNVFVIL